MKERIVLVDDGTERTRFTREGLENSGYEVFVINNDTPANIDEQVRLIQPQILMLDDERIMNFESIGPSLTSLVPA